ncbi:hypothetical protein, partial [Paraburkholderia tropica]|uniref:hypothetical protein n=1 Tax=Paraburkholderia tropica TaxID=92647 RepID=UPI003F56D625
RFGLRGDIVRGFRQSVANELLTFSGLRARRLPCVRIRFSGTCDFGNRAARMRFGLCSDIVRGFRERVANELLTLSGLRAR